LCHGRSVFDSTMAVSSFSSLGMFNSRSIKRRLGRVWAGAIGGDVT
jgi:hypothetical protein